MKSKATGHECVKPTLGTVALALLIFLSLNYPNLTMYYPTLSDNCRELVFTIDCLPDDTSCRQRLDSIVQQCERYKIIFGLVAALISYALSLLIICIYNNFRGKPK